MCVCVCCHCSGGQTEVSESEETTGPAVVLPKAPSSHESPSFLHDPIAMYVNYNCSRVKGPISQALHTVVF